MKSRILSWTIFALVLVSALPAFAACTNPPGEAAAQFFSKTYKTMQYCDGEKWVPMGASPVEAAELRKEVDALAKQNAKFARRVDALEKQLDKLGIGIVESETDQ